MIILLSLMTRLVVRKESGEIESERVWWKVEKMVKVKFVLPRKKCEMERENFGPQDICKLQKKNIYFLHFPFPSQFHKPQEKWATLCHLTLGPMCLAGIETMKMEMEMSVSPVWLPWIGQMELYVGKWNGNLHMSWGPQVHSLHLTLFLSPQTLHPIIT